MQIGRLSKYPDFNGILPISPQRSPKWGMKNPAFEAHGRPRMCARAH